MRRLSGLSVLPFLLVACGGSGTSPAVPSQVEVNPPTVTFAAVGQTQQMSVRVLDAGGAEISGLTVAWSSTNEVVATVSPGGLVTAQAGGSASIRASVTSASGTALATVSQVPMTLTKVAGDAQTGEVGQALLVDPTVEVKDANGNVIPGQTVTFQVLQGGGNAVGQRSTDQNGRASTSWVLGPQPGAPQMLRAAAGALSVEFSATGAVGALLVQTTSLDDARATLPYQGALQAVGGSGTGYTWTISAGTPPAGLVLASNGQIQGTPSGTGTSTFTVRVTDDVGTSAERQLNLDVCEAPLSLAVGQVMAFAPSGTGCGFFIPSGAAGDYYRVGVQWIPQNSLQDTLSTTVQTTLRVAGLGVTPAPPALATSVFAVATPSLPHFDTPELRAALAIEGATGALHETVRAGERLLTSRMEQGDLLPDLRGRVGARGVGAARAAAPDTITLTVPVTFSVCASGTPETAVLRGENAVMAVYQTVGQAPVSQANVQRLLDYYRDYGRQTIDAYFGGVSDINGDGQVIVVITPQVSGGVAAFVWSGDFNSKSGCQDSDEREQVYFNASVVEAMGTGNFQAVGTLVHEAKHVSSLYQRVRATVRANNANQFHPAWVEEGTAEIAGEMSSRLAWAAAGGPAVNQPFTAQQLQASNFTLENYGLILRLARVVGFLSSQPNTVSSHTLPPQSSAYGSSWLFHRFLGDAYANAASSPLADQNLFKSQNDSLATFGTGQFPALTGGKTYPQLLTEFAQAVLLAGTGAPEPTRRFTTVDFSFATEIFSSPDPVGRFPWPVTITGADDAAAVHSRGLVDATFAGPVGPGGLRIFDFQSNGSGVGATFEVDAISAVRVYVTRLN